MSDNHPPPGWRPMWELPAPGRKRKFVFKMGEGFLTGELPTMCVLVNIERVVEPGRYDVTSRSLAPIGWMYA